MSGALIFIIVSLDFFTVERTSHQYLSIGFLTLSDDGVFSVVLKFIFDLLLNLFNEYFLEQNSEELVIDFLDVVRVSLRYILFSQIHEIAALQGRVELQIHSDESTLFILEDIKVKLSVSLFSQEFHDGFCLDSLDLVARMEWV